MHGGTTAADEGRRWWWRLAGAGSGRVRRVATGCEVSGGATASDGVRGERRRYS